MNIDEIDFDDGDAPVGSFKWSNARQAYAVRAFNEAAALVDQVVHKMAPAIAAGTATDKELDRFNYWVEFQRDVREGALRFIPGPPFADGLQELIEQRYATRNQRPTNENS